MILGNLIGSILLGILPAFGADLDFRQCEPIRIDLCRNVGYNETAMPNMVGNELQHEVEYTLQTFTPLIEYVCSTQLKLFLCATYVPMCTPKVPVPIGPCRSLCESVRSHCHPVLQGFGYPWPPALECSRFPKENNQDSMCMEGPDEADGISLNEETLQNLHSKKLPSLTYDIECPSFSKLYVKLHRLGRCASLCNANILFTENEKHIAEIWTNTWTYAGLGICLLAIFCLISDQGSSTKKPDIKCANNLCSLVWCHTMVTIGWTIRFIIGRTATACGFDPQLPNVPLLLVDGLSNIPCASNFFLRYYFGMASCAWWAMLCLGWHRNVRRYNPDLFEEVTLGTIYPKLSTPTCSRRTRFQDSNITMDFSRSHLVRFLAWGLPAFQTVAVIVTRLVDADELLGACFVGNQSDKGLQIFVATPLFCYWIFGAMNLSSGFLVYRRNKGVMYSINSPSMQMIQPKTVISGWFLFIYCIPFGVLLLTVIYEFVKIDDWLNLSPNISSESSSTPIWPFLLRVLIELTLSIYCSGWIIGPKLSALYQRQFKLLPKQQAFESVRPLFHKIEPSQIQQSRSITSYRSVQQPPSNRSVPLSKKTESYCFGARSLNQNSQSTQRVNKRPNNECHTSMKHLNTSNKHNRYAPQSNEKFGSETII